MGVAHQNRFYTEEEAVWYLKGAYLAKYGRELDLNRMTGIPGDFYRDNRREDLLELVEEILEEKDL